MVLPDALKVAICIPAKNERENLTELLKEIDSALNHPLVGEALVVIFDDGSDDETFEHMKSIGFSQFELRVLHSIVSLGKSAALQHAIDEALALDSDVVVMMDGDCQDNPSELPDFLESLRDGHEVVNGRRANREHGRVKRLSSRAFNAAVRQLTGLRFWDINSGYKAFSRSAATALRPYFYGELHRVILVIAVWLGLKVGEVRVVNRPRKNGKSHYGITRAWRGFFDMVTIQFLRRYHARPGHFFSGIGSLLLILGAAVFSGHFLSRMGIDTWFAEPMWAGLAVGSAALGAVFISLGFLGELVVFSSRAPATAVVRSYGSYPSALPAAEVPPNTRPVPSPDGAHRST